MMIRETLTKTVRSLLRKQKQHRDLQRRGVREEPPGGACCSVLRRRRGLQGFWQRGSPGSGRGCSCRCRHPPPSPPAVGVRVAAVVLRRRRVDHVGISRGRLEQRRARGGEEVEQPTLLPLFLVVAIAVVLDVLPTYAPTPRPSALPMPTLHPYHPTPLPIPWPYSKPELRHIPWKVLVRVRVPWRFSCMPAVLLLTAARVLIAPSCFLATAGSYAARRLKKNAR